MTRQHVDHSDIARFARDRVNLPRDKASEYRAQARRLREKLDGYLNEHPDFTLKKMLLSGSLAKGTALRSLNDIDLACYISGADTPNNVAQLLEYLAERLRKAFPNFSPDQVVPQTYSVTVSFRRTGLDVDVVPILYDGDPQWHGRLVSQDDGSFLETSIPLHLEFIGKRKTAQEQHFTQVVRLVKFWAGRVKGELPGFRFKSFMIEMILSHLCDKKFYFHDYPEALQHFFTYISSTNMREKIIFTDYYRASAVGQYSDPVQIIDPVNENNNVASLYTAAQADAIVEAALDAGDARSPCRAYKAGDCVLLAEGLWPFVPGMRRKMTYSYSVTDTKTFTRTHAVHITAKVAADLKRMQRFYGAPSDEWIQSFNTEAVELLKEGYLGTVVYGFWWSGCWIEPTLCYTARDLMGVTANDDDPGRIRPGALIGAASFHSYLTYNSAWNQLTWMQRVEFAKRLPFQRTAGTEPGVNGYWSGDLTYSSGGRALDRTSLRSHR